MSRSAGRVPTALAALLVASWSGLAAQEPERPASDSAEASGHCTLTWRPIDPDAELIAVRTGPEAHVSYVSGRMLWTCGTATMEADSTVKYDRERRIELLGNVVYRDSIRTLESRLLDYYELQDLVVAREEVELVRTGDGSTLTGPRVEFLRAISGVDAQTTATGRPHMTFVPEGEGDREPFEVDADRAVFAGENEARAFGDVVVMRSDLRAEADSAYLTRDAGAGVLWGEPWVEAEGIRLEGDTIRFRSEEEELRDVHALGNAFATGEEFEVRSERIDVAMAAREVERVWSYGEGLSEAFSADHRLYGDSLAFALTAGRIDTVYALGDAVAIQDEGSGATSSLRDAPRLGGPPVDSAAAELPGELEQGGLDTLVSLPDSVRGGLDTLVTVPDSALAGLELLWEAAVSREDAPPGAGAVGRGGPDLAVDGSMNWVRGDTLTAIFEPPPAGDSTAATPEAGEEAPAETEPGEAAAEGPPEEAEGEEAAPGGGAAGEADEQGATPADSTPDPRMERLTVVGDASAFYRQVRDTTADSRPSRNYLLGTRIDILFEEGEARRVLGQNAIGIFLEPEESFAEERSDSARMEPDSLAVPDTAAAPDSAAVADSLVTPPDSGAVRRDSTDVPPDSTGVPPDSTALPSRSPDVPGARPGHASRGGTGPLGSVAIPAEVPWTRDRDARGASVRGTRRGLRGREGP